MKFFGCLVIIFCFFTSDFAQYDLGRRRTFNYADSMYRKPTKKELELVAVDAEIIERHKEFLSNENTGIFRLMPDLGCNEDKNVIVATDGCLKYTMPGAGSAFSFRKNIYRIWRLSDLIYREGVFFSGSKYTQGIIGGLGNIDLDDVSANSNGVKELSDFVPVSEYKAIEKQYERIAKGIIVKGVFFSNKVKIHENATYILRSIAYRTKSYTIIGANITYNEFEFDKRFDILIAFRVLKKDKDGSVIILWKEIWRKESPKLQFPKQEEVNKTGKNNIIGKN